VVGEWCTDATTGGARPTREDEDALQWVRDNAMGDDSCTPLAATLAGVAGAPFLKPPEAVWSCQLWL
jgi:hypothetical protein